MVADKVARELTSALETMKAERDDLDEKIRLMEELLSKVGGAKRGPGRPRGSGTGAKRGPGRPPKEEKQKVKRNWSPAARKAAAERARKMWAERRKKSGKKTKTKAK